jgi:histidine triad (HIT) family protein
MADFEEKCIFCNIAQGKVESKKIYEDDKVIGFLDINPANPGHVLLIPKKHVMMFPMMDEKLVGYLFAMAKKISLIMLQVINSKGSTFLVANGVAAGQKAPHAILHIIPRYQGDSVGLVPETQELDTASVNKLKTGLIQGMKKVFDEGNIVEENSSEESPPEGIEEENSDENEDDEELEKKKQDNDEFSPDDIADLFLNK